MPGIATAGFDSPRETFASEPTTSCSTRPVCSIEAGAPSAARIVGARSISSGGLLERLHVRSDRDDRAFGPVPVSSSDFGIGRRGKQFAVSVPSAGLDWWQVMGVRQQR
jgi:hypothetical protein